MSECKRQAKQAKSGPYGSLLRAGIACALVTIGTRTFSQQPTFLTHAPDVFVTSKKHPSGADLVTVRLLKSDYPLETLKAQCLEFGKLLGSNPRGLFVYAEDLGTSNGSKAVTATFGVDGFVDRTKAGVKLQALVRAFATGDSRFKNEAMKIVLEGETPATASLQTYRYPSDPAKPALVEVRGDALTTPPAIEYTIKTNIIRPDDIVIPDSIQAPLPEVPAQNSQVPKKPNILPILLGAIGVGVGAVIILWARLSQTRNPHG